ncbi:MAG: hypothetical protein IPK25_04910 [Saprospiraceae bacterium]|nr:hypothetical protein [Saprospiraceae bacterium]
MDNFSKSQAYFEYFSIDNTAFRDKVRYYEENQDKIGWLNHEGRLEMDMDYCLCLFEIGRYQRFLQKVDIVIEDIIFENVYEYMAVNIYEDLLFKKAACCYNLNQTIQAEKILIEIMRINAGHEDAGTLLALCKRKSDKDLFVIFKDLAVVSLFVAISITIARIILIEPFYDQYLLPFIWLRNILLVVALVFVILNEIIINYEIYRDTGRFPNLTLNKLSRYFSKKRNRFGDKM